jgi:hypothetical protein
MKTLKYIGLINELELISVIVSYENNIIQQKEFCLLGYKAVYSTESSACYLLHSGFFAYSSTLKMEAICSSETSVFFHWTTRHYTAEDSENLKSYISLQDCKDNKVKLSLCLVN